MAASLPSRALLAPAVRFRESMQSVTTRGVKRDYRMNEYCKGVYTVTLFMTIMIDSRQVPSLQWVSIMKILTITLHVIVTLF